MKKVLSEFVVAVILSGCCAAAMGGNSPEAAAVDERGFTQEDYAWWAAQPVVDPVVPSPRRDLKDDWQDHPIDRFIAVKLHESELETADAAPPEELVRRMFFDLHGLPPTPEQVAEFVAACAEDVDGAVEVLIDSLLASPQYGERWGQHWLDIARFAESDGYRADFFRPEAWRYRDYVIQSFNDDKPYDQFVREQLAADEFAPDDPKKLIATAFLRHGIYEYNQRNARMNWELILNEMTNVTGEVFLGLGVGCAQCHDHKFDPILQRDYYSLQAFLSSTWWPEHRLMGTEEEVEQHRRKEGLWEQETVAIRREMDELVGEARNGRKEYAINRFPEDVQAMYRKAADSRSPYEEQLAQLVQRQIDYEYKTFDPEKVLAGQAEELDRFRGLKEQLKAFKNSKPEPLPMAFIATDVGTDPALTWMKTRDGKESVEPAFLTLLGLPAPEINPTPQTTGRRGGLARWIADPKNPFSTRVIVNRVWQHHFGRGIVATPNDFGMLGGLPSHPELLDWLTCRFIEGGWKLKTLHRMILTSATYRQTARREPPGVAESMDPGNRLLWRFPPQRLSAEQVRDAMLAVSGELEDGAGRPSEPGSTPVRSIYVKKLRNTPDPVLQAFDAPSGFDSAPDRLQTTTPAQSLLLANNQWPLERAEAFARRVLGDKSTITDAEIIKVFQLAYGRAPKQGELEMGNAFVHAQLGDPLPSVETVRKFPDETGLRPIHQAFSKLQEIPLGEQAVWLQPTSRFERLEVKDPPAIADAVTIEAVVVLDSVHPDASVNTLISHWNGNPEAHGWSLGVTSAKSRFQPLNVILQLVGTNAGGGVIYEVVPSDLYLLPGRPYYVAVTLGLDSEQGSRVVFFLKDLSDPGSEVQSSTLRPGIVNLRPRSDLPTLIGGRASAGHLWDGQLARLAITAGVIERDQLLLMNPDREAIDGGLDWIFSGERGEEPVGSSRWRRSDLVPATVENPRFELIAAMTELCHAVLSSNEFLYLH